MIRLGDMQGRRVVYTGAAGGLGCGATLALLAAGSEVFSIDRDASKNAAMRTEVTAELAERLHLIEQDLTEIEALRRTLRDILRGGAVDLLINNAAIYPSKPFEDYTLEEQRFVQAVNVDAALVCTAELVPAMRAQSRGRIINVTSITLTGAWENLSPYVQSKGALLGLTRAWAREFGKWGITVNAIAPGAFPTDAEKIHPEPEKYQQFVLEHQAVKRRGTADDIAAAILFLASDAAGFITGQSIAVDGGWSMR